MLVPEGCFQVPFLCSLQIGVDDEKLFKTKIGSYQKGGNGCDGIDLHQFFDISVSFRVLGKSSTASCLNIDS